jgi:small subunit ribosomal protein S5
MPQRELIKKEFDSKVVEITRVTRVVAGGKRMRFRALVVIGDRNGKVGIGVKKGADVADAVGKATANARKNLISVPIVEGTIPHLINIKYKAAKVLLKPAKPGAGIIAGGPIRAVLSLAGVKNITSKMLGSANKISNVRATFLALKNLRTKERMNEKMDGN